MPARDPISFVLELLDREARSNLEMSERNTTVWIKRKHRAVWRTCMEIASAIRAHYGMAGVVTNRATEQDAQLAEGRRLSDLES